MEFVFVETATSCPQNYHTKLQWRAVAGCYQCCEIRTVSPRTRNSLQIAESTFRLSIKSIKSPPRKWSEIFCTRRI